MRSFRERYDWLRRELSRRGRMKLGEICMAWNCGPDAAKKAIRAIHDFDPHIELRGREVVWVEKPYDFEAILEGLDDVVEEEVKADAGAPQG